MKKKFLFSVQFLLLLSFWVYCLERNPHEFKESECAVCHQGDLSSPYSSTQAMNSSNCSTCHAEILDSGFMHPFDVKPEKIKLPRDFPLSSFGYLTCSTCHDVHGSYMNALGGKTYFLRREERGREFCASCHAQIQLSGDTGHESILGEAHFQSKYISIGYGQEIDETSKNCISCHDGTYASSISINTGVWSHGSNYNGAGFGRKHPIGIDYEEARLKAGRKSDLRPMDIVDSRFQFFDGKIGCGTCHNPYSSLENNLVIVNRRSALCFACHAID